MKEWIKKLKIAIIEEDGDTIIELSNNIPKTNDVELAREACLIIAEAIRFAESEKIALSKEIEKFRKAKGYFN